jgi:hypothetical protein
MTTLFAAFVGLVTVAALLPFVFTVLGLRR